MKNHKSLFITFEGGEAVGKSSLVKMIYESLSRNGYDVVLTREPGGSDYGEKIRDIIFKEDYIPSSKTELLLMFAARRDHIEQIIKPALQDNKIVLCDRYIDSSYVYQAHLGDIDTKILDRLCEDFVAPTYPNKSYFIHVNHETALKRIQERGIENRNDNLSLEGVKKLSDAYQKQAQSRNNIMLVKNDNDISEAYQSIIDDIKKQL